MVAPPYKGDLVVTFISNRYFDKQKIKIFVCKYTAHLEQVQAAFPIFTPKFIMPARIVIIVVQHSCKIAESELV